MTLKATMNLILIPNLLTIGLKLKKALNSDTTILKAYTNEDSECKVNFTLGEPEGHSNKIQFEISIASLVVDSATLKFNADYLKAIFDANYNATGKAYVSNDGAMKLEFENEEGQKIFIHSFG